MTPRDGVNLNAFDRRFVHTFSTFSLSIEAKSSCSDVVNFSVRFFLSAYGVNEITRFLNTGRTSRDNADCSGGGDGIHGGVAQTQVLR